MPDDPKNQTKAEDSRPVPSQAEGDEATVDEALRQHEKAEKTENK